MLEDKSNPFPSALNPAPEKTNGTVLTRLGDRALQFLALKLAYQIGKLPPGEVQGDHPLITELRQLVESLD